MPSDDFSRLTDDRDRRLSLGALGRLAESHESRGRYLPPGAFVDLPGAAPFQLPPPPPGAQTAVALLTSAVPPLSPTTLGPYPGSGTATLYALSGGVLTAGASVTVYSTASTAWPVGAWVELVQEPTSGLWFIAGTPAAPPAPAFVGCRYEATAGQSLTGAKLTWTALGATWDYDVGGLLGVDGQTFTAPAAGYYDVHTTLDVNAVWDTSHSTQGVVLLWVTPASGSAPYHVQLFISPNVAAWFSGAITFSMSGSTALVLAAGDAFYVTAVANAGGGHGNVAGVAGAASQSFICVTKVG